jgi:hypothetical protein
VPAAFVTAVPTVVPSTAKVTVAPETGAPPVVRVSEADKVTGLADPKVMDAGLGA